MANFTTETINAVWRKDKPHPTPAWLGTYTEI